MDFNLSRDDALIIVDLQNDFLPGGNESVDALALATRAGISPVAGVRLEYRHGSRALAIAERMARTPRERRIVCPCEPVTEAEIRYTVEREFAVTVDDVSRRTRLGLGACGGLRCALPCGAIVAEMTDESPAHGRALARSFLVGAQKRRLCALGPEQARQEALIGEALRAELGTEAPA